MIFKTAYDFFIDLLFPNRCGFCGKVIPWNNLVCEECEENLTYSDSPITFDANGVFTVCVSPCDYKGVARRGVLNLKYHYGKNTAKYLLIPMCELICEQMTDIDVITCVPMTGKRKAEYGYNQAEVIAKIISDELGLLYDGKLLSKQKGTGIQHKRNAAERKIHVKGVYTKGKSSYNVKGKTVLIADDIITTGSTLSECASVLKSMGAKRVYCVTLAKTFINSDERSKLSVQS